MQILGIDSSTKKLSIALSEGDTRHYSVDFNKETGFMVNIISCIDNALKKAGTSLSDVDVFSVNIGPGDFTGTRIGISVAKTLALVTEKPVYGIEALDACAAGLLINNTPKIYGLLQKKETVLLLPVLDVKRNEVFFSIYEASLAGDSSSALFGHTFKENNIFVSKVSGDHLVDCESFISELDKIFLSEPIIVTVGKKPSVFVSGTGFLNYKHLFKDIKKINCSFYLDSKSFYPDARFLNMCSCFRAAGELKNTGPSALNGCSQAAGQTEGADEVQPEQPGSKAKKPILKGDKNVAPLYVRDYVPFIKKQDI